MEPNTEETQNVGSPEEIELLITGVKEQPSSPSEESFVAMVSSDMTGGTSSSTIRKRKAQEQRKMLSEEEFIEGFQKRFATVPKDPEITKHVLRVTSQGWQEWSIDQILAEDFDDGKHEEGKPIVWYNIDSPSKADMQLLEDKFDLHPLTTEDILSVDGREKVDSFDNYVFVVARELHYADGSNKLISSAVNMVIFPNTVLSIHSHDVRCIPKVFYTVEQSKNREGFLQSSDWVLYAVLDAIVNLFRSYVNGVVMEGEALDELVLIFSAGEQNDLLRRVGMARRTMMHLRGQLWTKRDMLVGFTSKNHNFITNEIRIYLRDVLDHLLAMEQRLEVSKEMLNNLHQTYLARVSLEVAEASTQVNFVMKKFSAVATMFIPLTLVAGLFGMNVKVPGQDTDNLGWFFGICVVVILIMVVFIVLFRKRHWL